MSPSVQNLLDSFEQLPEPANQEFAVEIIRRTRRFDLPPLTDEELILTAEELFLELGKRESTGE